MMQRSSTRRAALHLLKRAVTREGSADAMFALLQRSVRLGHKKLALLRCLQAERMGIPVPGDILAYCQQVAAELPMLELEGLLGRAASAQGVRA